MPKHDGALVQCGVRLPEIAIEELDTWADEVNTEVGWKKTNRSDLIRDLVLAAIEQRRTAKRAPLALVRSEEPPPAPGERFVDRDEAQLPVEPQPLPPRKGARR